MTRVKSYRNLFKLKRPDRCVCPLFDSETLAGCDLN